MTSTASANMIHDLDPLFDDHPSLDASLADFENTSDSLSHVDPSSPMFQNRSNTNTNTNTTPHTPHTPYTPHTIGLYPSHHSGFLSDNGGDLYASDDSDKENNDGTSPSLSGGGYSPPAWRRAKNGTRSSGFWEGMRKELSLEPPVKFERERFSASARGSRESSPEYESADDGEGEGEGVVGDEMLEMAKRTRLPTGSLSPERRRSPSPEKKKVKVERETESEDEKASGNNYIRFALRAEVQHRTEPIEAFLTLLTSTFTKSRLSLFCSLILILSITLFIRAIILSPSSLHNGSVMVPDLIKVAGLAKAFEPLIYYSENGVSQIGDLQATGVAVWDLGESVRGSNMTSGPLIVRELDDLSESLKTLSLELTRFFANVDGDVDGILIVMDWARRELTSALALPPSPLLDSISSLLTSLPLPPTLSRLLTPLTSLSPNALTLSTLSRTFTEFLTVLEESINAELTASLALFALFEAVDRQFLNLARSVIREADAQERLESEMLSSLWIRVLGGRAGEVRKFERNRELLRNVRSSTVRSKGILVEHNGKLQSLKANLEMLRKKLVGPLVRSNVSAGVMGGGGGGSGGFGKGSSRGARQGWEGVLEAQIRGLEGVEEHLRNVRERQKGRVLEVLYGRVREGGRNRWSVEGSAGGNGDARGVGEIGS